MSDAKPKIGARTVTLNDIYIYVQDLKVHYIIHDTEKIFVDLNKLGRAESEQNFKETTRNFNQEVYKFIKEEEYLSGFLARLFNYNSNNKRIFLKRVDDIYREYCKKVRGICIPDCDMLETHFILDPNWSKEVSKTERFTNGKKMKK